MFYTIITTCFLFFTLFNGYNSLPSGSGSAQSSTKPGPVNPYGNNAAGDSFLQCYSAGTSTNPKLYTQLSNTAWNQWLATAGNAQIPHSQLASSDFRCTGGIFKCLVIEQTPATLIKGSIYQASPSLNCGTAPSCTAESSTGISLGSTIGWQAQLGVQVEWGSVKVTGAGTFVENWTTTTTDTTTATCAGSTGQTVCLAYQPILWQSLMRCTIRGVSQATYKDRSAPDYESWSCPPGNQVLVQVEEAGADKKGVGAYSCVTGADACSAGFNNIINPAYLTPQNIKKTTKKH